MANEIVILHRNLRVHGSKFNHYTTNTCTYRISNTNSEHSVLQVNGDGIDRIVNNM